MDKILDHLHHLMQNFVYFSVRTYFFCFTYLLFKTHHIRLSILHYFSLNINFYGFFQGGTGEHGLHYLNFQGVSLYPWMWQRMDPPLLGNYPNQQYGYQAMLAAGMQNLGSADLLRHQVMQFQQPLQGLQQPGSHTSLLQQQQQQQQQAVPLNILQAQTQVLSENMLQHLIQQSLNNQQEDQAWQQQHTYQNTLHIRSDKLHQRLQSNVPSSSFVKADFMDPSTKFSASISPRQNMVSSL